MEGLQEETLVISMWEGVRSPSVFVFVCVRKSEQYVLGENGRACGVKPCSPAPVTVSDPVTISTAFELLRLGRVKGQFCELLQTSVSATC